MLNSNPSTFRPPTLELQRLCTDHLRQEAEVLAAALSAVRAIDAAFTLPSGQEFAQTVRAHARVATLLDELHGQRLHFRESVARLLMRAPAAVTLPAVVAQLSLPDRAAITAEAARVRSLAEELTVLNHRVSICLRIHLDAYQRILRDLTQSSPGSGRYGPTGSAESHDYRPLIQIHG